MPRLVVFLMGRVNQRASRHGVLAFTVTGAGWSMCAGRAFARAWKLAEGCIRDTRGANPRAVALARSRGETTDPGAYYSPGQTPLLINGRRSVNINAWEDCGVRRARPC